MSSLDQPCPGSTAQIPVNVGQACHESVADVLSEVLRLQADGFVLCGYEFQTGPDKVVLLFK